MNSKCWVEDKVLTSSSDNNCKSSCIDNCGDYFAPDSILCDCSHGKCMSGCEQNCALSKSDAKTECDTDCAAHAPSGVTCSTVCEDCVNTKNCWGSGAKLGSADDLVCVENCYNNCETWLGPTSKLCNCEHGHCISGCK